MASFAKRLARWRPWLVRGLLGGVALSLLAILLVPLPDGVTEPPEATLLLLDRKGRELASAENGQARMAVPVPLEDMGRWLPSVTVALEDHRYPSHPGVDPWALAGVLSGQRVGGASTIEQQLLKLATTPRRGLDRKLYENLAAIKLSTLHGKDAVLEAYLNRLSYGNRRQGPEAAARSYFGKAARHLTLAESIYLAGLPKAPTLYNPWSQPRACEERYRESLRLLSQKGFLSKELAGELADEPPRVRQVAPVRRAEHFVDALLAREPGLQGRRFSGLDLELQEYVQAQVAAHLNKLESRQVEQAAVVVLDNATGEIRAMVGSRGYHGPAGQNNGALLFRSPGSALKPFVYLNAIDGKVLTAATLLPDTPDAIRRLYPDYDPVNYDKRYQGPVRVRDALGNSLNVTAVVAADRAGPRPTFAFLQNCGLRFPGTFERYGAGMVLGNGPVRLIDLAGAFRALVNRGEWGSPQWLQGGHGERRTIASPEACDILIDILSDNSARQITFGPESPLTFGQRVPVKTGTSSGFRDAWCVGSTGRHTVAVWMGNFDGRPMLEVASSSGPGPLWRRIINRLLPEDGPVPEPHIGDALTRVEVCALTGLLPGKRSPGTVAELFLAGTEPAETADTWFDPDGRPVLPAAYAVWCRSVFNTMGARAKEATDLAILQPADGSRFTRDPALPEGQQLIQLVANRGAEQPEWFWNGRPVAAHDGKHFIPMEPGKHTIELRTESGRARAVCEVR